jgi:hypothetical protein
MVIYILKHSWFNRSWENFVFKNWYLWHNYQYGCHMSILTLLLTVVVVASNLFSCWHFMKCFNSRNLMHNWKT